MLKLTSELSWIFTNTETIKHSRKRVINYFKNNPQLSLLQKIKYVSRLYPTFDERYVIKVVRECENQC